MNSDVSAPPPGGFFLDEVDAASSARCYWGRDPDGDDGAAGAVSRRNPAYVTPDALWKWFIMRSTFIAMSN